MIRAIAIDDEPLALDVIKSFCTHFDFLNLEHCFTKPSNALDYLNNNQVDLVFVDIQMPSINGINLVKSIDKQTMIIFTTAYSEYAMEGYNLNAIDYLLKPINKDRFYKAIEKAKNYFDIILNKQPELDFFYIKADFCIHKINFDDIECIESLADYLKIYISDKKTIVTRMTMKEMLQKLPSRKFIRVNRSFIVPDNKVISLTNKTIKLSNRDIPIGNTYINQVFSRFMPR